MAAADASDYLGDLTPCTSFDEVQVICQIIGRRLRASRPAAGGAAHALGGSEDGRASLYGDGLVGLWMDGSAADGQHPLVSSLLLVVIIRRLQRTGGTSPDRPSAKKDRQKGRRQEVGQEVQQARSEEVRQEVRKEGYQEGGTEAFRPEERQEIGKKVGPEEFSPGRQARQVRGPQGIGQDRISSAGKERGPAALTAGQLLDSSRAIAAAQLISAM